MDKANKNSHSSFIFGCIESGLKDSNEKKYKIFMLWGIIITSGGILMLVAGLFIYIFGTPQTGINLSTLQPVMMDGSKPILIGLMLLIIGGYRLIFKRKAFREINHINYENEEEYIRYLKNKQYGQKKIKKLLKAYRKRRIKSDISDPSSEQRYIQL